MVLLIKQNADKDLKFCTQKQVRIFTFCATATYFHGDLFRPCFWVRQSMASEYDCINFKLLFCGMERSLRKPNYVAFTGNLLSTSAANCDKYWFYKIFMETLSLIYALFFMYILYVLLKFLIRPSYFNSDIISASICGYMVLIEIMTFLSQTILCFSPHAVVGIGYGSKARVYIDCIYFSTITITSIG